MWPYIATWYASLLGADGCLVGTNLPAVRIAICWKTLAKPTTMKPALASVAATRLDQISHSQDAGPWGDLCASPGRSAAIAMRRYLRRIVRRWWRAQRRHHALSSGTGGTKLATKTGGRVYFALNRKSRRARSRLCCTATGAEPPDAGERAAVSTRRSQRLSRSSRAVGRGDSPMWKPRGART